MKNFGKVIAIPLVVLALVVVGAVVYKFFIMTGETTEEPASATSVQYDPYSNDTGTGTGGGFETSAETSGNPATDDLEKELMTAEDDGGLGEIDELQEEASGL